MVSRSGYSVDNDPYHRADLHCGEFAAGKPDLRLRCGRTSDQQSRHAGCDEFAQRGGNTFNADNGMTGFSGTTLSYDANGGDHF